ncbi:septal ring lytic transglycosylase RlpA family protein [Ralstonia nicotianae]|nr:septal ring lytic transglycosylase RlpA family protein [Ralstonia solanacearum]
MTRILGTVAGVNVSEDDDGRVYCVAGAAIDADGANGQHGEPAAYKVDDSGSDYLANAAMKIQDGKVVCASNDARDIVILGADDEPQVFQGGLIASKTWYQYPGTNPDNPVAYVDAETVPYVVVNPLIVHETVGVVRGCKARVTYNGNTVECVVADKGSSHRIGELSIAAARALGINSSPRNGGMEAHECLYEIWPGVAAPGFVLQAT